MGWWGRDQGLRTLVKKKGRGIRMKGVNYSSFLIFESLLGYSSFLYPIFYVGVFFTSIFTCENITIKSKFRYCCEIINIKYGMIILPLN